MAKFHINDQGNAGQCSAVMVACPFGGDEVHFSTAEDARKAYEAAQNPGLFAKPVKKAPPFTNDKYRAVFNGHSVYSNAWNVVAIPQAQTTSEDGEDRALNKALGLDQDKVVNLYHSMAASLKSAARFMTKVENAGSGDKPLQLAFEKIEKACNSKSPNRAYAALTLLAHIQQERELQAYNPPKLGADQQAVVDHLVKNKTEGPFRQYAGYNYLRLRGQDWRALAATSEVLKREPATWTSVDIAQLDSTLTDHMRWLGRGVGQGAWPGFGKETPPAPVIGNLRAAVGDSIINQRLQVQEADLVRKALGRL